MADDAIAIALVTPLVGAVAIHLLDRWPNIRETATIAAAAVTFIAVLAIFPAVDAGGRPALSLFEFIPGLALHFVVEPLGMLFALVASFLWIITSFYSIGYMRGHHEENQTRFYVCFAIAISAALGVAMAGNMMTLFIAYEVLTLSTYPLVTHHKSPESMRAGRVYLGILLATSIGLQLVAIVWTWATAGTLEFTPGGILAGKVEGFPLIILLFLYMYGIGKAALMPIHRWLPAAMVAPTPVSALLHAVAVVKAGVFTVLKVTIYIFGVDYLSETGASTWLMYVAGFTIIAASVVALTKDNLKARLAYSTISQLAYIVLAAALATTSSIIGGAMHIAMHAFGKITLFFCAGAILVAAHKTEISDMAGLGRRMPLTFAAFAVGALSIIGLPPMGGAWSKWFIGLGAADAGEMIFIAVLMVSSLLNVAYLIPVAARAFVSAQPPSAEPPPAEPEPLASGAGSAPREEHAAPAPREEHHDDTHGGGIREAPIFCLVPIWLTALGCIVLFVLADDIAAFLAPIAER